MGRPISHRGRCRYSGTVVVRWLFALVVAILSQAQPAALAQSGLATVHDGDTLTIGSERIRLFGIDAPELAQECGEPPWSCGLAARDALIRQIDSQLVSCHPVDRDRYGRVVAICEAGGVDLAQALVSQGLAVAYVKYSTRYVDAETHAKSQKLGVWSGPFDFPWVWRNKHPRP